MLSLKLWYDVDDGAKDDFASRVRSVPLNRFFKHNKLFLTKNLEVVNALPKYPHDCSEDEKFMVESMARQVINLSIYPAA